jgi:hypothetical protein
MDIKLKEQIVYDMLDLYTKDFKNVPQHIINLIVTTANGLNIDEKIINKMLIEYNIKDSKMLKKMTEFECLREAGKHYKGVLTLDKAINFLKFENGWDVEIIEKEYPHISKAVCDRYNVTQKQMQFMKDLQESGEVNMFACSGIVQQRLLLERDDAKNVVMTYIKHYTEIYFPEQMLIN